MPTESEQRETEIDVAANAMLKADEAAGCRKKLTFSDCRLFSWLAQERIDLMHANRIHDNQ